MPAIVCNAQASVDVSKKAELDSECLRFHEFPERHFERNEVVHHREGTTFLVELLEEFPRVILTHTLIENDCWK
jgi:hypothetical protein